MTPERWRQIREIFDAALELNPKDRSAFLREACNSDTALHAEVLSLIASFDNNQTDFLEHPVAPNLSFSEKLVDAMEGRRLGPYQLQRRVGKGGMGTVYAASRADNEYEKLVAVKLVKPGMDSEEILRRFRNERQVLASLDHPNIARLLDGGTTDEGLPYLVMEYVEGLQIDKHCDENKLTITQRLKLFCAVCSAVQYAHQNLVVHRDLKPSNIIVTTSGTAKLLDFGISKLLRAEYGEQAVEMTRTHLRPMTPEFASPEQVRGEPITTSTDIYALGVLLYRLITGHHPYRFDDGAVTSIEKAILNEEPDRPSTAITRIGANPSFAIPEGNVERLRKRLSGDLDMIVLMALRKEPLRRYQSAGQFAEDIWRHIDGLPVRARKDTLRYRVSKFVARHKAGVAATALVLLALIVSVIVSVQSARVARVEKAKAEERFNDIRQLANFVFFDFDSAISSGVTTARKALIGKALVYLSRLAPGSGGDISLQRELIDGYSKVGDLQGNLYGPNLGSAAEAKESYTRALRIAESVAAADPDSVRSRIDLAQVKMKLIDLMSLGSARKEALDKYREAEAVFQPLANSDPRAQRNLMEVARRIGFTQYQLGDMNAALKSYERYLQLAGVFFSSDRQSAEARRAEAYGYERIGYITARSGAVPAGLEKMRRALRSYEELAATSRTDSMAQRDVANTYTIIGDVLAFNGKNIEAAADYRKALAVNTAQAQDDPRNQQCQRDLHNTLVRLADVLAKARQNGEARAMTDRALKVLQPMVESAEASEYDLQQYCYVLLTTQFADLRNPPLARQYAQKLVDRSGGQDPRMLDLLASAYDAAGDPAKAVEVESKALELLPHNSASDLRAEMQKYLDGFRARAAKRKTQR